MSSYLFDGLGYNSLERLKSNPFLLAFDFDGTLAPFVDDPVKARVLPSWRDCLHELAAQLPMAVISGRRVHDLQACLQIPGCMLVGNHGAQPYSNSDGLNGSANIAYVGWIETLDPLREHITSQRSAWELLGVRVEDKGISIAFHYRQATHKIAVKQLLENHVQHCLNAYRSLGMPTLRVWRGHDVINVVSANAPDKGDALLKLQKDLGLAHALFVGDDSNDEPAFAKALPGSVTVKIGGGAEPTSAQYFLYEQCQVGELLHYLTGCIPFSTAKY